MMSDILGKYEGDVIELGVHYYVPKDRFSSIFDGCNTYQEFKDRDAGVLGYEKHIEQWHDEGLI
jgi:hypothetical protein